MRGGGGGKVSILIPHTHTYTYNVRVACMHPLFYFISFHFFGICQENKR